MNSDALLVMVVSGIATLFFGCLNYLVWFRYPAYLRWVARLRTAFREKGLPPLIGNRGRHTIGEEAYKWYTRLGALAGLLVAAFPLVMMGLDYCNNANDVRVVHADIPGEPLGFPASESKVIWMSEKTFFIQVNHLSDAVGRRSAPLAYLLWEEDTLTRRFFPAPASCSRYRYYASRRLLDGRLGLVRWCGVDTTPAQNATEAWIDVLALDVKTGTVDKLVAESLPPFGAFDFSWNPVMNAGVQETGSLFSTIIWLSPEKAEPMDVEIHDGGRRWSLAENFHLMVEGNTEDDVGIAKSPAWSPQGNSIAFFASAAAIGRRGPSRATGEYELYLMNVATKEPEVVLDQIYYPGDMQWSPAGGWLAFAAKRSPGCPDYSCLWLFAPQKRVLVRLTQESVSGFSWAPDGNEIVANVDCDDCASSAATVELVGGKTYSIPPCDALLSCNEFRIYDVGEAITKGKE